MNCSVINPTAGTQGYRTGNFVARMPEIVSHGFMSMEDSASVMQEARQVVLKTLKSSTVEERGDWGVMQEKIRTDLRRFLNKQTQRRPLIMPVILEV